MFKKIVSIVLLLLSKVVFAQAPLIIVLDWYINPDQAPLLVAQSKGFFKAAGLEVKLVVPSNPSDGPKLVADHQADLAITYTPSFIVDVSRGLPIAWAGTLVNQPLNCLMVLKSGSIHNLADLKNKKIGYGGEGFDSIMLGTMLKQAHLSLQNVSLVNVNYDLVQGLLTHRLDAAISVMRNVEPVQLAAMQQPTQLFYPEQYGVPPYDELIFVTNASQVRDVRIKKFISALSQATTYLRAHPEDSWQMVVRDHPELNTTVNHVIWMKTVHYFANNPAYFDRKRYQIFTQFMLDNQLIKSTQGSVD